MNSESEFLAALEQLMSIAEEPIEYRVYYNQDGKITQCSMRNHSTEGNYLIVTADEYENYFRYTVVNCKLKKIDIAYSFHLNLKKGDSQYRVVKNHAGLLLEPDETYTDTEYYDTNN